jgi:hypothetical protein
MYFDELLNELPINGSIARFLDKVSCLLSGERVSSEHQGIFTIWWASAIPVGSIS